MSDSGRYAIYFAPAPEAPLARFGAEWLGYDAATGLAVPQPQLPGIKPERLQAITAEPRRYGFHATLKPPFVLADGQPVAALEQAVAMLAGNIPAFVAPPLRLARLAGFWALVPSEPCPQIDRLAERCVRDLDRFRAPPSADELARRRRAALSPRQEALLLRWGYPYVMDEFRFHMTLTARLDAEEGAAIGRLLASRVEPFCRAALAIDAVALFRQDLFGQDTGDAPFRLLRRYPLSG